MAHAAHGLRGLPSIIRYSSPHCTQKSTVRYFPASECSTVRTYADIDAISPTFSTYNMSVYTHVLHQPASPLFPSLPNVLPRP